MIRAFFILTLSLLMVTASSASEKPVLTVYSYNSFFSKWGAGNKIKQDFEAQCDCVVRTVRIDDGVMILNRLRFEGDSTKADVIIGLDTNLTGIAKKENLIQPHDIARPNNLAIDWWDDQFIPYDYGYFAFIYNKNKISSPPSSFTDLLKNEKWKIVYQDPRTSTPGLGLLLWINMLYGDKAPEIWTQLAKRTLTVTKGWNESYGLFVKGEADFVLSYSTSPAVHIINDQDDRYKAAIFDEGNYLQIELAAITKYTKHPELAKQFLAFLLTANAQQQFVEKNIMYPVIDITLPAAYANLTPVKKSLSLPDAEVMNNQKQWIRQWQDAISK